MSRRHARLVRIVATSPLIAAAVALAPLAPAQEILRQWFGDAAGQRLGGPIAWVGDVNADGFVDIGVAAPADSTTARFAGMLRVISGKDGAVLYSFYGDTAGAMLGTLGHPIGDIDLDGHDDVLVSEPYLGSWPYLGRIFVFSGRDGSVLLKMDGTSTQRLSGSICGTGNVDGDGVPDFAASSSAGSYVTVFSGATSAVIRTLTASDPASTYFGHGLLDPGDIDGDGVDDLIVLENGCYYTVDMNYYAFSGATGARIWQAQANTNCWFSVNRVRTCLSPVVVGDINGDGISDWAMGTWSFGPYSSSGGSGSCFSGKDGSPIFNFFPTIPFRFGNGSAFGQAIAAAGDVNGDGVPDVAGGMLFHAGGTASAFAFGNGIAGGLDCDGDGKLDFFAGDVYDGTNGPYAGAVTQFHIEPFILDIAPRNDPVYYFNVFVDGGVPGTPIAIFLAEVNGSIIFNLLEIDTVPPSRIFNTLWYAPYGLTGITARFLAISIDGNGRLLLSNYETMTFP
jgi:hypothetical protein